MKSTGICSLVSFLGGLLVGSVAAMLTTPQSGAELRSKMFYERIKMCFVDDRSAELFERIDNDIKNKDNGGYIKGL